MVFDLKALGTFLCETGLMDKKFRDMNHAEITRFCEHVHCATVEHTGWTAPYFNKQGDFVIPHDAPVKYRYWSHGGQPLLKTLQEMGCDAETIERYCPAKDRGGLPMG